MYTKKNISNFKQQLLTGVLTVCTLLSLSAHAGDVREGLGPQLGGKDGGGGFVQKSTRADLEEVVSSWDRIVWEASDSYLVNMPLKLTSVPISAYYLREMTQKMIGLDFFSVTNSYKDYLKELKFKIQDEPCIDNKKEKDASTQKKKNAEICLSASRLSRFPKSTLRQIMLPLVAHEVAHQFGYEEPEANAFQDLAALNLVYREVFLSAQRTYACKFASSVVDNRGPEQMNIYMWPSMQQKLTTISYTAEGKINLQTSCAVRAYSTGENLERVYNGDLWKELSLKSLSPDEVKILLDYTHTERMSFVTVIHALESPSIVMSCSNCSNKVDKALIMMLAGRAAIEYIDYEVGRQQNLIVPHEN